MPYVSMSPLMPWALAGEGGEEAGKEAEQTVAEAGPTKLAPPGGVAEPQQGVMHACMPSNVYSFCHRGIAVIRPSTMCRSRLMRIPDPISVTGSCGPGCPAGQGPRWQPASTVEASWQTPVLVVL